MKRNKLVLVNGAQSRDAKPRLLKEAGSGGCRAGNFRLTCAWRATAGTAGLPCLLELVLGAGRADQDEAGTLVGQRAADLCRSRCGAGGEGWRRGAQTAGPGLEWVMRWTGLAHGAKESGQGSSRRCAPAPMPLLAPVMTTVLFCRSIVMEAVREVRVRAPRVIFPFFSLTEWAGVVCRRLPATRRQPGR